MAASLLYLLDSVVVLVAVLEFEGVRISCANGSSVVASPCMDGAPGLQVCSADGDCALSVGTGGLATASSENVDGTVEGMVTITGLHVLCVGESMLKGHAGTTTCFPGPDVIRRSRCLCSCVRRGLFSAVTQPSRRACSKAVTIFT